MERTSTVKNYLEFLRQEIFSAAKMLGYMRLVQQVGERS